MSIVVYILYPFFTPVSELWELFDNQHNRIRTYESTWHINKVADGENIKIFIGSFNKLFLEF